MLFRRLLIWLAVVLTCSSAYGGNALWKVRPDGVGPVKIGMQCDAVARLLREPIGNPGDCTPPGPFYVSPKNLEGLNLLFIDGVLSRIRLAGSSRETSSGISVGDPLAKLEKIYGHSLHREPGPGGDGANDVTVELGEYAVLFEISGDKVADIWVGYRDAIGFVE